MAKATQARSRPSIAVDLPERTPLEALDRATLSAMLDAGKDVLECYRVLKKTGDNIVGELLRNAGTFYQWQHYPKGDVYDRDNGSQFYYHAHPKTSRPGEHGHFHTFLRATGMPRGMEPVPYAGEAVWPLGADSLSHIVAISMDKKGIPTGLFTVNRWVTGDAWYRAEDVATMVDRFAIDHAQPSWPVNRWITGMLGLFAPLVKDLVRERDTVIAAWRAEHPDQDVFEDRNLEIVSSAEITVEKQIGRLRALLA
jgi:hypothetical protein